VPSENESKPDWIGDVAYVKWFIRRIRAVAALNAIGRKAELFILRGTGGHMDGLTQMAQARKVINDFLAD
jgi:hypothetical protein